MMTRTCNKQIRFHMLTIEDLVPENHFLRKLEQLIDFSFIYEETKEFYCHNNGRPSIDPVILVKYLLIGFLYGIESERRLEQDIFLCPEGNGLLLKRLQRNEYGIYREYRAEKSDCQSCPLKGQCLTESFPNRRLQVNLFEEAVRQNHSRDGSTRHREVLRLRQIWCEGSFAAQKAHHNLKRYCAEV